MASSPKSRVQVVSNLAVIARTRQIEPVDPDDPAMTFMPPLASVEELSSSGPASMPETDNGSPKIDAPPPTTVEVSTALSTGGQAQKRNNGRSSVRPQGAPSQFARVNKAESADYTRVTLRLRNDVITRLVAYGLSRSKRYTTVIEDFIMAGLDRHQD